MRNKFCIFKNATMFKLIVMMVIFPSYYNFFSWCENSETEKRSEVKKKIDLKLKYQISNKSRME